MQHPAKAALSHGLMILLCQLVRNTVLQLSHPTTRLAHLCPLRFSVFATHTRHIHASPAMGKRTRTTTLEPLPEKPMPEYSSDVTVDGKEYTAITEGLATVLFPKRAVKIDKQGVEYEVQGEVFYNPIQQFNRDLSVLAIKTFADVYLGEKKARAERKKKSTGGRYVPVGSGGGSLLEIIMGSGVRERCRCRGDGSAGA